MFSRNRQNLSTPATQLSKSLPQPIRLGIWGTRSAGKTVYMLMLYHYLSIEQGWNIAVDQETEEFINKGLELMLDEGKFVLPTLTRRGEAQDIYSYTLSGMMNNQTIDIEIQFFDISGETLRGRNEIIHDENGKEITIVDYLLKCHGILFLVSPLQEDRDSRSYYALLGDLFRSMQNRSGHMQLEQYVVFGITKVDHEEVYPNFISKSSDKSSDKSAEKLFIEMLGRQTNLHWFENFFHIKIGKGDSVDINPNHDNRCGFFYISPFGVHKDKNGDIKSIVERNEQTTQSQKDPILDPIETSSGSGSPYEMGSKSKGRNNTLNAQGASTGKYKINIEVPFNPINMIEPIGWLIQGIINCPPNIPIDSSSQANSSTSI